VTGAAPGRHSGRPRTSTRQTSVRRSDPLACQPAAVPKSWASPAVPGWSRNQASGAPPQDVKPSTGRRSRWASCDRRPGGRWLYRTLHEGEAGLDCPSPSAGRTTAPNGAYAAGPAADPLCMGECTCSECLKRRHRNKRIAWGVAVGAVVVLVIGIIAPVALSFSSLWRCSWARPWLALGVWASSAHQPRVLVG
jgi:hypothetical protein